MDRDAQTVGRQELHYAKLAHGRQKCFYDNNQSLCNVDPLDSKNKTKCTVAHGREKCSVCYISVSQPFLFQGPLASIFELGDPIFIYSLMHYD